MKQRKTTLTPSERRELRIQNIWSGFILSAMAAGIYFSASTKFQRTERTSQHSTEHRFPWEQNRKVATRYELGLTKDRLREISFELTAMEHQHAGGKKYQALWRELDSIVAHRDSLTELIKK